MCSAASKLWCLLWQYLSCVLLLETSLPGATPGWQVARNRIGWSLRLHTNLLRFSAISQFRSIFRVCCHPSCSDAKSYVGTCHCGWSQFEAACKGRNGAKDSGLVAINAATADRPSFLCRAYVRFLPLLEAVFSHAVLLGEVTFSYNILTMVTVRENCSPLTRIQARKP